ncbi:leucine-rich repeat protein kinase family protein [Actinidia rufa]|uniref:non-specific serine/threonine protein kinase n=1 Tax=Actinidia rufa TaxID=165716 RepID=A0A7J0EEA3_9ERIC|nr:leucine-rich repeat protein kinase family protein [Actinidia rufa]
MSLQQSSILAATATSMPGGNETDRLALLAFKAKVTEDPFQVTSSWNATVHFCKWPGVTCGRRHQRVTILNLMSQKLVGTISPHLGNLSFLRVLHLQNNSFTGEIPPELGYLKRLQILRLHNNSISGVIPADLSACSELVIFNLFNNRLVGKNSFTARNFSPAKNHLVGRIPDGLSQLADLTVVVVRGNSLTGTIPASLFNHSSLMAIDVGTNQIEGSLPPHLGNTLPSLQFLSIYRNQFTGSIPVSISNATNLAFLIAGRNGLTGKVPTLEKLQKLQRFTIAINSLGSGKADDLTFLSLFDQCHRFRSTAGNVPPGICNLANLEALYLAGNQLTGNIPHEIGRLRKLQQLAFAENRFSGIIPHTVGNLTLLSKVTLSENQIYGSIPSSIGKCRYLVYLDLCCNNLTGVIPKEVFDLSSLSVILDLSQNHLTGSVPMNVGNLKNLGYLDFSENKLSGEIPATLGSCVTLEILYLEANLFQGTVPTSLRFLRGIQFLNLSHNNLSGEIPEYLEDFDFVQNLDLSFNDFGGEVPTEGIFKNASATSIIGNSKLCGGVPELRLPKCETKKRSTFSLKFVIPVSCGLVVAILLMGFVYWIWFKKSSSETSSVSLEHSPLRVSYRDLLKATDGFSSANLMGVGSFGSVYKGVFSDGMVVAVKVLNLLHRGASTSFLAECMTLRNIRHRNLVKVLTACSGIDYQGNVFKALVYQYMVNGSLDEWLHPHLEEHMVHKIPANLNLLQRVNIAIDVASALDYLHHHCQTPIVHCDLKPSNVLLDNEMNAHVSDFGLAKFLLEGSNRSSVNQSSSVGVRGSFGYAAPEYGMGRDVSTTGDVYSYGILLLEMLTGKRPTDAMFNDNLNLHSFAQIALAEGVEGIADPVLLQQQDEDIEENTSKTTRDSGRISQTLGSIFRIGIACSAESPRERPNMRGVVSELLVIRGDVLGAGSKRTN